MIHIVYEIHQDKSESIIGYTETKQEAKQVMERLGALNPNNDYCSVQIERA